jgi:hypothetical protein
MVESVSFFFTMLGTYAKIFKIEIPAGKSNNPRILSRLRLERFEQDIIRQIHKTS